MPLMPLCLALLGTALAAWHDLLPLGHRAVRHELVLQPGPATARWRFVAAPTAGFGVAAVAAGEPFRFSTKYGTRLWALPPDAPLPARHDELRDQPSAALPIEIGSTPFASPLAHVVTTLELIAVEDSAIRLRVVDERRYDAAGRPLEASPGFTTILLLLAATGLAGTLWLSRRLPGASA
jgi:hypothetical protein